MVRAKMKRNTEKGCHSCVRATVHVVLLHVVGKRGWWLPKQN